MSSTTGMHSVTTNVDDHLYTRIVEAADASDRNIAGLVRHIIKDWFDRQDTVYMEHDVPRADRRPWMQNLPEGV